MRSFEDSRSWVRSLFISALFSRSVVGFWWPSWVVRASMAGLGAWFDILNLSLTGLGMLRICVCFVEGLRGGEQDVLLTLLTVFADENINEKYA